MHKLIYGKEVNENKWSDLLNESPHASPFQSPEFLNLFNDIPGITAHVFAVEENDHLNALALIIEYNSKGIRGYFSRRCIIYGGPLISDGQKEALDSLLEHIGRFFLWRSIYMETRNFSGYDYYEDIFRKHGWKYIPYLDFRVKTNNRTAMNAAMSASRRRQIKRATADGVEIRGPVSISEVEQFYAMLKELYVHKIKKPLIHVEFFRNAFENHFGKFLLVWYKKEMIGGIFCPILERRAIYEFYVCGMDTRYKDQYPSIMATWSAMDYACNTGIPIFDFMGAGRPDEEYGVREFKARFGGELVEFGRYHKINNTLLFNIGRIGLKILKKLA